MATAKPSDSARRKRGFQLMALVLLALLAGLAAAFWRPLHSYALTGAAYGARMGCSCHYVEGRPLGDCPHDFEAGMGPVSLNDNPQDRSVSASYLLFAHQTARFVEGQGCLLEPWKD